MAATKGGMRMTRIQKRVIRETYAEEFARRGISATSNDIAGKSIFRIA